MFWDYLWRIEKKIRGVKCFFIGHKVKRGYTYSYEPDWCDRCFCNNPEDKFTAPQQLQKLFAWIVERDWQWFETFDSWLCNNYGNHLPSWWEY